MDDLCLYILGVLFFGTFSLLAGSGVVKLAQYYQSIGIINQSFDLKFMENCILRYGIYCFVIVVIYLVIKISIKMVK